jgi:hypothetical protein
MTAKEETLKVYTKLCIEKMVADRLQGLGLISFSDYLELINKCWGFRHCMRLNNITYEEIEACENYIVEIEKP